MSLTFGGLFAPGRPRDCRECGEVGLECHDAFAARAGFVIGRPRAASERRESDRLNAPGDANGSARRSQLKSRRRTRGFAAERVDREVGVEPRRGRNDTSRRSHEASRS
jgi:hypothetical protein